MKSEYVHKLEKTSLQYVLCNFVKLTFTNIRIISMLEAPLWWPSLMLHNQGRSSALPSLLRLRGVRRRNSDGYQAMANNECVY